MIAILSALALMTLGGLLALMFNRHGRFVSGLAAASCIAGCILGLTGTVPVVLGAVPAESLRMEWLASIGGSFNVACDALSGFFGSVVFLICGLCALYGTGYMRNEPPRSTARSWFFFNTLTASMILVLLARNAILFLVAWETMALASFFLVTHEHHNMASRRAGALYLAATHIGTAFLIAFMLYLGGQVGSFEFDDWWSLSAGLTPGAANILFVCAIIGFGTKAGFVPLHIWLPEAHPAAPSHVSAVMSGVMIKTGIYGLLRFVPVIGVPTPAWAWTLIAIGVVSGVLGVLFALAQHDMKRLLAYSSVENMGIITMGLGVGMLGHTANMQLVEFLGYSCALLHVLNHALFKSLLFLGAGSVYRATGTREMDLLGGLQKVLPVTALCFITGSAAIAGLPSFNGFVSEFLLYWASFSGAASGVQSVLVPMAFTAGSLALIGGLAAACFAKIVGIVFLGESRSSSPAVPGNVTGTMRTPMVFLALACVAIGLAAPVAVLVVRPAVAVAVQRPAEELAMVLRAGSQPLVFVSAGAIALLGLIAILAALRMGLLFGRDVRTALTWDCGFIRPSARMQYSAASFAQPIVDIFASILRSRRDSQDPSGLFPANASFHSHTSDVFKERLFAPAFRLVRGWAQLLKWMQSGRIQLYVFYIVVALVAMLYWTLRSHS